MTSVPAHSITCQDTIVSVPIIPLSILNLESFTNSAVKKDLTIFSVVEVFILDVRMINAFVISTDFSKSIFIVELVDETLYSPLNTFNSELSTQLR